MWELRKQFRFEASHQLPEHDGKCARLHGHSWIGYLVCTGDRLVHDGPKSGMLVDYGEMKHAVDPLVDAYLDHRHLNETTGLANPTSEELARWIYDRIKLTLPSLDAVVIEETCTSRCEYRCTP